MTKQINLFKEGLLPGFGHVQLPTFLNVILLAIALSVGWFYFNWSERQALINERNSWQQISSTELENLETFQRLHPDLSNQDELKILNDDLSTKLQVRRATFSGLENQIENAVDGFTAPLTTLSDYDLNGLWLSSISLEDGKRLFSLEGYARKPELIPLYLEQLSESSFNGITVKQLAVNKVEKNKLWRFTMSNHKNTSSQEGL